MVHTATASPIQTVRNQFIQPTASPPAMKREGRQHGMVQTHPIISSPSDPSPNRRINTLESPSTAGPFTKVSSKPTNHSKFTGKCGRPRCAFCRIQPAGKAKDKTKGNQKMKSSDVVANYRLVTWRVVDARPDFNFTGFSATGILDHLANDCIDDNADDVYGYYEDDEEGVYGLTVDSEIASRTVAIEEVDDYDGKNYKVDDGKDSEKMSFCDVGFAWEQVEGDDEDWCLVEEIQLLS